MQRDEVRKIITEQFYNSLNTSGVQINAIPSDQLNAIVAAMADSVFATLAAVEQDNDLPIPPVAPATPPLATPPLAAPAQTISRPAEPDSPNYTHTPTEHVEEVRLWQGRPYLSIGLRYELTSQRLRIYRGILGNRIEEIELIRVKDSRVVQNMGERMLNIGDITIVSADPITPEIMLNNIHDPVEVRELLRKAVMNEKSRRGLYYREDISDAHA